MVTDSYDAAPEIVFAYRLSVIRTKRAGIEVELFIDEGAFLTGDGTDLQRMVLSPISLRLSYLQPLFSP